MTSIPILSLVVAVLAVFIGPIISWCIAKRQITSNLAASNKQIIAPMRQAWINNLRNLLSEISSLALHYYVSGFDDRTDEEYMKILHLEYAVKLMLNPQECDHQRLENLISEMTGFLGKGSTPQLDINFRDCHRAMIALSRDVLKREWDRVKEPIPLP